MHGNGRDSDEAEAHITIDKRQGGGISVMEDEKISSGWHVDKRVSVGHIVTTAVVGISALLFVNNLDKRISVLEEVAQQHAERFDRNELRWTSELAAIRRLLERIDDKLDGKVDRTSRHQGASQ